MTEETNLEQQSFSNPFSEENWVDPSVEKQSQSAEQTSRTESSQSSSQSPYPEYDEVLDENAYVKKEFGFDDIDSLKQHLQSSQNSPELKFENEDSRKFYEYAKEQKEDELINFLQEKKKIERLYNAEIKDAKTAEEIVKLSMYNKNKDLDQTEIDFLFNEKFQIPQKPQQKFDETDSEYEERVSSWESRVNEIEKRLVIEAKLAKPELEKLKSELILPELNPSSKPQALSQEDLEAQKRYMDYYYSSVDNVINSFDGITATVKDEGADFSVAYIPSDEEKQAVANQMKYFAENDLDANMIFADRWVNDDNTINVQQMAKDLFLIQNEGKISQKFVNEAANRRLTMHLKNISNVNLNTQASSGTFAPDNRQTEMDKLAAIMFAK